MRTVAITWLGWAATATFVASYFFVRAAALRTVQMLAALMWVSYGWLIGAAPVIVANVLVIVALVLAVYLVRCAVRSNPSQPNGV